MLSIILPCYNEAENIPFLWNAFKIHLKERNDVEVIFVNNGSVDSSESIFSTLLSNDNKKGIFNVVNVPLNKGYGYGILAGLENAKGEVIAWTHADMQTNPEDVVYAYELYLQFNNKWTFIKGSRVDRKFHAWIFSYGMEVISSWVLKQKMDEINAQPKLFSKEFYIQYLKNAAPFDFSLDLFACYQAYKYAYVVSIPVKVNKRKFGEAKGGGSIKTKIKLIYRTLNYIVNLYKKLNTP